MAIVRKEMQAGKISIYDEKIVEYLENLPMNFFQTAADFMLLKGVIGQPAQHIAACVMAIALDGHVKKMRLIEADLDPVYPELTQENQNNREVLYLEVVFPEANEEPEVLVKTEVAMGVGQFIEEIEKERWYVVDTSRGLIFEKNLFMKIERPKVKNLISGQLLQDVIEKVREEIHPTPGFKPKHMLIVLRGLEALYEACPNHKYRDLLHQRIMVLQEEYFTKLARR